MIEIYGKPGCTFCEQALTLAKQKNLEYQYFELSQGQTGSGCISREDFMQKFPSARTVPQIVVAGTHVGGFAEFKKYLESASVSV
jgi:glutaredoxin 3